MLIVGIPSFKNLSQQFCNGRIALCDVVKTPLMNRRACHALRHCDTRFCVGFLLFAKIAITSYNVQTFLEWQLIADMFDLVSDHVIGNVGEIAALSFLREYVLNFPRGRQQTVLHVIQIRNDLQHHSHGVAIG